MVDEEGGDEDGEPAGGEERPEQAARRRVLDVPHHAADRPPLPEEEQEREARRRGRTCCARRAPGTIRVHQRLNAGRAITLCCRAKSESSAIDDERDAERARAAGRRASARRSRRRSRSHRERSRGRRVARECRRRKWRCDGSLRFSFQGRRVPHDLPPGRGVHRTNVPIWLESAPTPDRCPGRGRDGEREAHAKHPLPAHDGRRAPGVGGGGRGRTLVKAANWLTHLEYEWESPVWRHWIRFFSDHFRFVRYDERGCGMSDWEVGGSLGRALGRGPRGGRRRRRGRTGR